jgi:hypothetical protein
VNRGNGHSRATGIATGWSTSYANYAQTFTTGEETKMHKDAQKILDSLVAYHVEYVPVDAQLLHE